MTKLSYVVAAVLVLAALGVSWQAWQAMAGVALDTTGVLAIIFGALVTLGLGAGLVALMFISNRRGFDEQAVQAKRGNGSDKSPS
jgi:hypothetical protein